MDAFFAPQRAGDAAIFSSSTPDGGATPSPIITAVTVTPQGSIIDGAAALQFSALVTGTNGPAQAVTWSSTIGTINAAGLLAAPVALDGAQTGIVTATSLQDPTKYGSASFTVRAKDGGSPQPITRLVSLVMGEAYGPAANLTDLMVSFHVAIGPHATGTAIYQSASGTTDASGRLSFTVDGNLIAAGGVGLLSVLAPDGRHFLGRVAVL